MSSDGLWDTPLPQDTNTHKQKKEKHIVHKMKYIPNILSITNTTSTKHYFAH